MEIKTKYPIIINGVKESPASEYLSAEGELITSSKNPIIINGKHVSNPTWYLSMDGENIDTMTNVEMSDGQTGNGKSQASNKDEFYDADGDNYSYIDKKNTAEVKAFQDWLDAKGLKWVGATNAALTNGKALKRGSGYGTFGPSTTKAYAVYGAEWEATRTSSSPPPPPSGSTAFPAPPTSNVEVVTAGVPTIPTGSQPTAAQIEQQKKKGVFWNKAKGVWVKAKEAGIFDWLGNVLGITPAAGQTPIEEEPRSRKMGSGVQTAIIIGGIVIVGLFLYSQSKKSK